MKSTVLVATTVAQGLTIRERDVVELQRERGTKTRIGYISSIDHSLEAITIQYDFSINLCDREETISLESFRARFRSLISIVWLIEQANRKRNKQRRILT